jgi:hypothetical protein
MIPAITKLLIKIEQLESDLAEVREELVKNDLNLLDIRSPAKQLVRLRLYETIYHCFNE